MIGTRTLPFIAAVLLLSQIPDYTNGADAQGIAPFELPAIFSLSGQVAYSGKDEQQTFQIIANEVNRTGGIQRHPLKVTYYDDQSNPQVAVQLTNQLIAKGTPAIIGPVFTASCAAAAPLVENGPFVYCLTPGFSPKPGGYVFSPAVAQVDQDEAYLRYCLQQHWTRLAIITTTDASGQNSTQGFQVLLSQAQFNSIKLVDVESMGATDISVTAQLQRIKAAQPDLIFFSGSGPPYGTALRGITDAGISVPIASTGANMSYTFMDQYKDVLPKTALFTGSRGLSTAVTPKGPVLDAQRSYFRLFEAAGVRPDGLNENVWDPGWILVGGLRHLGVNATAKQLRDYVLNLHGFVGVNGTYDFARGDQRGIGTESVAIYRWDAAKKDFIPISGPGGAALR